MSDWPHDLEETRKLAEDGNVEAIHWLIGAYSEGLDGKMDLTEAMKWCRRYSDLNHCEGPEGLNGLAQMYHHLLDGSSEALGEAARLYRKAGEAGYADAYCSLGSMYENGEGLPRDYAEALRWYRSAGLHGQWDLGWMHARGHGVPKDFEEAVICFRNFIGPLNMDTAQLLLGIHYADDDTLEHSNLFVYLTDEQIKEDLPDDFIQEGFPHDYTKDWLIEWLSFRLPRKASQQNADSSGEVPKVILGFSDSSLARSTKDNVEAYAWVNLALASVATCDLNKVIAQALRDQLEGRLTAEQLGRAQQRSTELHKEIEARKKAAGK